MSEKDVIVINITTEYKDNTNFDRSAKKADKFTESIKKTQKQADMLDGTKSEVNIFANDKAIMAIEKTERAAKELSKTKATANLGVNDKASPAIDKVNSRITKLKESRISKLLLLAEDKVSSTVDKAINSVKNLSGKTYRFTVGVIDKATAPLRKIFNYATSLKGIVTGLFAGAAANQLIVKPTQMAVQQQNIETAFENLLGSKEAATGRVEELTAFAGQTPFTRDEIYEASRVLQVFTGSALSTADGLKLVGDVASGTQQDFKDTAVWFGRLYDGIKNGTPIGEATARLQEMGAISGESRTKLEELAKSGRDISETWPEATAEFAQFDGMMEKMSDGFQNLLLGAKTFVNNNVWKRIGNGIVNGFTPALQRFREWRTENKELIAEMADGIENRVTEMVSKVSGGIEQFFNITTQLMNDDTFKKADFFGKSTMMWEKLIAEPFSEWWNGGGKDMVTEGVRNAANGLIDVLKNVIREGMEVAFSNPITGTMAIAFGIKHGAGIARGIAKGIKTAKGAGSELKSIFGTAKNIVGMIGGAGAVDTISQQETPSARHIPEVQEVASRYRKATDNLNAAKQKFLSDQEELVRKATELKELKANNGSSKAIRDAEKSLEQSRKLIKQASQNIENVQTREYEAAKQAFSDTLDRFSTENVSKMTKGTEKSFDSMQSASKNMAQSIKRDSGIASAGISEIGSVTVNSTQNVGLLAKAFGFLTSPVGLMVGALAALGGAAYFFSQKQQEAEEAVLNSGNTLLASLDAYDKAKKASDEATESYTNQKNAIQEYKDITSELNSGTLGDDERIEKLSRQEELLNSLKDKYPEVFEQDLSTEDALSKIQELADQQERLAEATERSAKAQADLDFAKAVESLPTLMQQLSEAEESVDHFQKKMDYAREQQIKLADLSADMKELETLKLNPEVDPALVEEAKENVKEKLNEIYKSAEEAGDISLLNDGALETLKERLQNNLDPLTDAYKNVDSAFENLGSRMGTWQEQLDTAVGKVENFKGQIDALKENAEKYGKKWEEIEAAAKEKMSSLDRSTDLSKGKVVGLNTAIGDLKDKEVNIDVNINENYTKNGEAVSGDSVSFDVPGMYTAPKFHAEGGIMHQPHIGVVAEDGGESLIPLSPKRRERGIKLWTETGRILGIPGYANGAITGKGAKSSESSGKLLQFPKAESAGVIAKPEMDISELQGEMADAKQTMQGYNSEILSSGLGTWTQLGNIMSGKSVEMNNNSASQFSGFGQFFNNFGGGIVTTGNNTFESLKQGVTTKSAAAVEFGKNKFNEFSAYVGTLPPIFGGYGSDMMTELQFGIEAQRGSVLKSTSSLVQDLLNTFITGLGIHSPSKKMQWIGEMMAAGIIKGLSSDQITQYVYYIIDKMQDSFASGKLDVGTVVDKLDDNIPALVAKLGVDPSEASSLFYPLIGTAGTLTSVFGERDAPTAGASTNHGGIDLAAPEGTPIGAVLGGLVTIAGDYGGYGNAVKIDHGNGVESLYGHMSSVGVAAGQQVTAGQLIGQVGSTGISTGSHLHLSMYKDGAAIDPLPYVQGAPIMAGNTLAGALMAEYNRRKYGVSMAGLSGGGDLSSWLMQALALTGQSMENLNALMYIAQMESGGDPNAINLWDSNAAAGHPSKGLMQTIDSTFNAYKIPGMDDIWNPVHNAAAAIRYLVDVYGGIMNHPGLGSGGYVGYSVGSRYIPYDMPAIVHRGEMIIPKNENPYANSGGKILPFGFGQNEGDPAAKGIFEENNLIPFPELESDTSQEADKPAIQPFVNVDKSNQEGSNAPVSVSITVSGINLHIQTGASSDPQQIAEIIKAQLPGIANDLCSEIAHQLVQIFGGMATKAS